MARFHVLAFAAACLIAANCVLGSELLSDPQFDTQYLALEVSGELVPPAPLAAQLASDLAAIRSIYPHVASIRALPLWMPGDVLVQLDRTLYDALRGGDASAFTDIFDELGVPEASLSPDLPLLTPSGHFSFGEYYHGQRLAQLFAAVPGVTAAFPNGTLGDGDDIDVLPGRIYELSHGFGDCPSGCTGRHTWTFQVTDEAVIQLSASPEPSGATLALIAGALLRYSTRRRDGRCERTCDETLHNPYRSRGRA